MSKLVAKLNQPATNAVGAPRQPRLTPYLAEQTQTEPARATLGEEELFPAMTPMTEEPRGTATRASKRVPPSAAYLPIITFFFSWPPSKPERNAFTHTEGCSPAATYPVPVMWDSCH